MLIKKDFEIKNYTSFKIGGKISTIFSPETIEEFVEILKNNPSAFVAGNWSNTLVSSDGCDSVISTSKLDKININGPYVKAQAGVKGPKLAQIVADSGLSGFEFMIGFPGSVGGEVYMNAGAHGQTISDKLIKTTVFDGKNVLTLSKDEMEFDYRTSICQKNNYIVLEAEFALEQKNSVEVNKKMSENLEFRKEHQPSLVLPNCGSVFKNPQGNSAGKLLDGAGVKGLSAGGAKVWENHANFIVNFNSAKSIDVLKLMVKMSEKVKNKYGIELKPEIRFLSSNNKEEAELWEMLQ